MVSPAGDEDDDEHMQNMFVAMPLLACYLYLAASYNNNRIYLAASYNNNRIYYNKL